LASIHAARVPAVAARWLRASVGPTVRLIAVDDIDFLRSDEKYTPIGWRGDGGAPTEAEVRTSLKERVAQLGAPLGGGQSALGQSCHACRG
jgi:hypothetical protein